MRRRLTPLLNPSSPSVRRRLVALAVLGVGVPILFLAGLGILQTSSIARFLRETTLEYGDYAARLVANALESEVARRANDAAENARLAAGTGGGASPQFVSLLTSRDPMLKDPFFTPADAIRSRFRSELIESAPGVWDVINPPAGLRVGSSSTAEVSEGMGGAFGMLPEGADLGRGRSDTRGVAPALSDSVVVAVPAARGDSAALLNDRVALPAWVWRRLLAATNDTIMVLPPGTSGPGSAAYIVFPIIGFPQRAVAVAGWRFDPEGLRHKQLHEIVEREVYSDARVFRGDVMGRSLAILLYDPSGAEVFRSRPVGSTDTKVVREIGGLLPGWRVVATPSKENAFVTIRRFIAGEYLLVLVLLALSLAALSLGLRLAVQQVEVAELKSGFLANVTHELKTPLAMIRMASETLELGRVRNEADSKRFLATISRECRRLTHMINNVLDFAKIEEGKREFLFAPTDLKRVIQDTLEIFEPQLKQGDFKVNLDIAPDLPSVEADSSAITQCVINLVDNAIKYSKEQKEIAIRAWAEDGTVRVSVSDRGIGVAPRDAERIFEKFTRAETGLVHNVRGSGLGLALVRHIARAHGGDVQMESVPGEGSTFTLILPTRQDHREEESGWQRVS